MYRKETLDLAKPLYCLTPFSFNGRHYQLGDEFPWRRIACSQRQVALMHEARKLRHKLPEKGGKKLDVSAPEQKPATQLPTDPPPTGSEPPSVEPKESEQTATSATLKHTGAGWYNIEVDGLGAVNESKLKGKGAAIKWAAENGFSVE